MTPMESVQLLQAALVVIAPLAVLLWALPGPCVCESCPKHTNERRMKALAQAELQHDAAHKGFGFSKDTPDEYPCPDKTCRRNPKSVD